jgi:hypothetical protein
MTRVERLSRAVCAGWGWDADRRHTLDCGRTEAKLWQSERVQDVVTAFMAMIDVAGAERLLNQVDDLLLEVEIAEAQFLLDPRTEACTDVSPAA